MDIKTMIVLGFLVALALYGISIYNRLVAQRNRFKNAFAQIDVQLQRRYDLIPNLVETAKGYLAHESGTLVAVIAARNQAQAAARAATAHPESAQAIAALGAAEGLLGGALGRLFALAEAYPDLKADQTMRELMEALSSTENKIAVARQHFNETVTDYNNGREQFPDTLLAGMFHFAAAELLAVEDPAMRESPKIAFD